MLLSGFVAARQKHNEFTATLGIVDAIPRTEVNLQLGYAAGQFAMLSWVAMDKSIDAHLDTCATSAVFKGVDLIAVELGHTNAQG